VRRRTTSVSQAHHALAYEHALNDSFIEKKEQIYSKMHYDIAIESKNTVSLKRRGGDGGGGGVQWWRRGVQEVVVVVVCVVVSSVNAGVFRYPC
jgi:hypothetical protein